MVSVLKYQNCRLPEFEATDPNIDLALETIRKAKQDREDGTTGLENLNLTGITPGKLLKIAVYEKDFFKHTNYIFTWHCETHFVPIAADNAPDCLRFSRFYLSTIGNKRPFFDWEHHLRTLNAQFVVKAKCEYRKRTMLKPKMTMIPTVIQTARMRSDVHYESSEAIRRAIEIIKPENARRRTFVNVESLTFELNPKKPETPENPLQAKVAAVSEFMRNFSEKPKKGKKAPFMAKCLHKMRYSW
uniref:FLYWCH-type domain-containing protein n=1 Tax=Caenorhabditis tropicalis TaxID=1561998 RepID=A0A1I7T0E0_9PELO